MLTQFSQILTQLIAPLRRALSQTLETVVQENFQGQMTSPSHLLHHGNYQPLNPIQRATLTLCVSDVAVLAKQWI